MTHFVRASDTIATRLSDEQVVAMDVNTAQYFGLDGPAAHVWDLLEAPHTLDEVVTSLLDAYDIDELTCRAQSEAFLADMAVKRLIVASE